MSKTNKDKWILKPGNALFFLLLALFVLFLILLSSIVRREGDMTARVILSVLCAMTTVGFFVYKYRLSIDKEYSDLKASKGMGEFNWWGELPLHLCNINMILIPIAVMKKYRPLMCFCFFLAPLGAFMAVCMPGAGFDGYSIFLPRMMGYFGTHFMIIIEGLALVTFSLYRPKFRDLPRAVLTAWVLMVCLFGFNMLLRLTGVYPNANYFYSVETEGNALLGLFYRWIPIPCLYLAPAIVILGVYMLLSTIPFALTDRRQGKEH